MSGRSASSSDYRYGFQGQERDDEVKGEGNSWNYKYRMHDPRLGRFFAVDPLAPKYPQWSPYAFSGNQVIATVELEGLEPETNFNENERQRGYNVGTGETYRGGDSDKVGSNAFELKEVEIVAYRDITVSSDGKSSTYENRNLGIASWGSYEDDLARLKGIAYMESLEDPSRTPLHSPMPTGTVGWFSYTSAGLSFVGLGADVGAELADGVYIPMKVGKPYKTVKGWKWLYFQTKNGKWLGAYAKSTGLIRAGNWAARLKGAKFATWTKTISKIAFVVSVGIDVGKWSVGEQSTAQTATNLGMTGLTFVPFLQGVGFAYIAEQAFVSSLDPAAQIEWAWLYLKSQKGYNEFYKRERELDEKNQAMSPFIEE